MNIGFDLDGVLYDWHTVTYEYCKNFLGIKESSVPEFFRNIREGKFSSMFFYNLVRTEDLYDKLVPTKSLMDMMNRLASEHSIFYITSRPEEAVYVTKKWLARYKFPCLDNLIFTGHSKRVPVLINRIDVFFDDRPEVLSELSAYSLPYLVRAAWQWSDIIEDMDYIWVWQIEEEVNKVQRSKT